MTGVMKEKIRGSHDEDAWGGHIGQRKLVDVYIRQPEPHESLFGRRPWKLHNV